MREYTRESSKQTFDVEPPGSDGLDLNTNPALLSPKKMRTAQELVFGQEAMERRKGDAKLTRFADPTAAYGAKTLGTSDAKYARFVAPSVWPLGGFGLKGALYVKKPSSGTAYYLSSWTDGTEAHGAVWITLASAGVLAFHVEFKSLAAITLTASPNPTNLTKITWLLIFDATLGTVTLYLDGVQAAQATGIENFRVLRGDPAYWYLGLSYKPGTGPDAGTGVDAAMGPFIGYAFRGADLNAVAEPVGGVAGKSLLQELREGTFQDWPNPASRMILFHYSMRESSGAAAQPMIDASKFKNNGAYVGTPTTAAGLVWPAQNGNFVGCVRAASVGALSDASVNIVGVGGVTQYQIVEQGV